MVRRLVLLTVLSGAVQLLSAQYVWVCSQNTLHLSNSTKGATKRKTIKQQNADYTVNMLQEVMKTANLSDVKPGEYYVGASGLKGKSSYKEKYAFIYHEVESASAVKDYPDTKNKFARPPSGILLEVEADEYVWFIDFHAIWGKSAGLRKAEATAMADVYKYFAALKVNGITSDKIVMGGDWNLGANDSGFDALKRLNTNSVEVTPNMKTSLTKAGQPSEAYDHFVAKKKTLSSCELTPIPLSKPGKWWRDNVSDHRGVRCKYTY